MKRLGYTRYVPQGGDWGAAVVAAMGRQAPAGLLGIHTNFPAVVMAEVGAALGADKSALAALSEKELSAVTAFPHQDPDGRWRRTHREGRRQPRICRELQCACGAVGSLRQRRVPGPPHCAG